MPIAADHALRRHTAASTPARRLDPDHLGDHFDRLYRAAWALCGSREDAEDLVQDTYARVLQKPRMLRSGEDLGYLLRVLRNTYFSRLRAAARRPRADPLPDELDRVEDRSVRPPEAALDASELYALIADLPDPFREALVAVDVVGLSYREAARALRVREATITTRLYRARQRLAHSLGDERSTHDDATGKTTMRKPGRHSRATERDLARLADGTLEPGRREHVERTVAGSGQLQSRLRDQRRALAAVRSHAGERAPLALRLGRSALVPAARRRSRALGLGIAGALAALVWSLAAVGGGQAVLTVADAATIAARPATTIVPEPPDDRTTLPRLRAAGLPFPYWEDRFGWKATGVRRDEVDRRLLTTVFYRRHAWRIAYTIVPGDSLAAGEDVRTMTRKGTVVHTFSTGSRLVVTWLRRGHTCVLSGRGVPLDALLELAVWRAHGELPY